MALSPFTNVSKVLFRDQHQVLHHTGINIRCFVSFMIRIFPFKSNFNLGKSEFIGIQILWGWTDRPRWDNVLPKKPAQEEWLGTLPWWMQLLYITQAQPMASHYELSNPMGECSHMHNMVPSDWLSSNIMAMHLVLQIFKKVGYYIFFI